MMVVKYTWKELLDDVTHEELLAVVKTFEPTATQVRIWHADAKVITLDVYAPETRTGGVFYMHYFLDLLAEVRINGS
jgi:hypothetical protein